MKIRPGILYLGTVNGREMLFRSPTTGDLDLLRYVSDNAGTAHVRSITDLREAKAYDSTTHVAIMPQEVVNFLHGRGYSRDGLVQMITRFFEEQLTKPEPVLPPEPSRNCIWRDRTGGRWAHDGKDSWFLIGRTDSLCWRDLYTNHGGEK